MKIALTLYTTIVIIILIAYSSYVSISYNKGFHKMKRENRIKNTYAYVQRHALLNNHFSIHAKWNEDGWILSIQNCIIKKSILTRQNTLVHTCKIAYIHMILHTPPTSFLSVLICQRKEKTKKRLLSCDVYEKTRDKVTKIVILDRWKLHEKKKGKKEGEQLRIT